MKRKQKKLLSMLGGAAALLCAALITISEYVPIPGIPSWSELSGKVTSQGGQSSLSEGVDGDVSVHFIDVGQGDSILIKAKDKTILIDAGENGKGETVLNYLKTQKVEKLDYVIGTHPHSDHIGGLDEVMRKMEVGMLMMPRIPDDIVPTSKTYEDVLQTAADKGLKIKAAKAEETLTIADGVTITILGPVQDYDDLNNMSIVAKLTYGNTSFLFTGDAEKQAEADLVKRYPDLLDSDVLKMGHHGSSTSSSEQFFQAVSPQCAVICCGKDNPYGHPHKETLELLSKTDTPYYSTEQNGSIVFTTDGKNISIRAEQ